MDTDRVIYADGVIPFHEGGIPPQVWAQSALAVRATDILTDELPQSVSFVRLRVRTDPAPPWRLWHCSPGGIEALVNAIANGPHGPTPARASDSRWSRETYDTPSCAICLAVATHFEE